MSVRSQLRVVQKSPLIAYIAAGPLVAVTALFVHRLQQLVMRADNIPYAGPNSIALLVPVILLAFLGGRGPGLATLALSLGAACYVMSPEYSVKIELAQDIVSLIFMFLAGLIMVLSIDAFEKATAAREQVTRDLVRVNEQAQRVAAAFQEPLIPHLRAHIPGVEIAHYYKPALDEAAVGGDFVDVFLTRRGDGVIILGDISGKGLAAATQVSTVRSMLRHALHDVHSDQLCKAIRSVNDTISSQGLLTGFVTLFVGVVDIRRGSLNYISCGHEPALLRRFASLEITELPSSGPVFGAFPAASYETHEMPLFAGDVLVLYTDGLSEAGPNRRNMFGTKGLRALTHDAPPDAPAAKFVETLVDGASSHANGKLHDDVCMLVCRFLESPPFRSESSALETTGSESHDRNSEPVGAA